MEKTNFSEKVWNLKQEIIYAIKHIVFASDGKQVNIPFYYDEDEYNEDVEQLIEDEYEVFTGKPYNNLNIVLENYCGYNINADIVSLYIKDNELYVVTSKCDSYRIFDVTNITDLVKIYDAIVK
jgi:hypothetical protein